MDAQVINSFTLDAALGRITKRGLEIATVIDVGASTGCWSALAERYWPYARFHLIEAFDHWRDDLENLVKGKPNYSFTLAAAGPSVGTAALVSNHDSPYGGWVGSSNDPQTRPVPMVSIDAEVKRLDLKPPYLIKLDTHGYEREIIAGATKTLALTNLVINEFYNYQIPPKRFTEMVPFIEELGFRCVDMWEPLWRPKDNAFWQIDMAFLRKERPEFATWSYD
jgi:FkbM family methyltransferase